MRGVLFLLTGCSTTVRRRFCLVKNLMNCERWLFFDTQAVRQAHASSSLPGKRPSQDNRSWRNPCPRWSVSTDCVGGSIAWPILPTLPFLAPARRRGGSMIGRAFTATHFRAWRTRQKTGFRILHVAQPSGPTASRNTTPPALAELPCDGVMINQKSKI